MQLNCLIRLLIEYYIFSFNLDLDTGVMFRMYMSILQQITILRTNFAAIARI